MSENDTDAALIFAASMMRKIAELPASELPASELRDLCGEVLAMVSQPDVTGPTAARKRKLDHARLYSRPDLEERGWTKTMMNRHLPNPDDHRDNPFYKCAGVMPLWLRSRVHRIEKNKGFVHDMERANARRAKTAKPFRDPLLTRREREQELIAAYLTKGMTDPEATAARQRAIRQARDAFAPADNFYG